MGHRPCYQALISCGFWPGCGAPLRRQAPETTSSRSCTSLRTRQGHGDLSPPLPASACAESLLLFAVRARVHSGPELCKFRTPLLGDSRLCGIPSACSVVCTFASALVPSVAFSCSVNPACAGLLSVPLVRAFVSSVSLLDPPQRELHLSGPWTPLRGLLHPIRSNRPPDGDCIACLS